MVASKSVHSFTVDVAGTALEVSVTAQGGDPALARDFADQLAQVVENKLFNMAPHHDSDGATVLVFPPRSA